MRKNTSKLGAREELQRLIREGFDLGRRLEQGRGNNSLTTALERIADPDDRPLQVCVLCDSIVTRDMFTDWLSRTSCSSWHESVDEGEHLRTLELSNGIPSRSSSTRSCKFRVADEVSRLADSPSLFQHFVEGVDLLLVAMHASKKPRPVFEEIATDVSTAFKAVLPLQVRRHPESEVADFPMRLEGNHILPVHLVTKNSAAPPTSPLFKPEHGLYQHLTIGKGVRQLMSAATLISRGYSRMSSRLSNSLAEANRKLNVLASDPKSSQQKMDDIKLLIGDQSSRSEKSMTNRINRRIQATSKLNAAIRNAVRSIEEDDLIIEDNWFDKEIRLCPSFLSRVHCVISEELRQTLQEDHHRSTSEVQELRARVQQSIKRKTQVPLNTRIETPSSSSVWDQLEGALKLDETDPVKVPSLRWHDLFSKARQKVFMIMMLIMLGARIGLKDYWNSLSESISQPAKFVFMNVVIGWFVVSIFTAKKEYRMRIQLAIEESINKFGQALEKLALKLVGEAEKQKLAIYKEHLKDVSKELERQCDAQLKRCAELRKNDIEQEKRKLEAVSSRLAAELKSVESQASRIDQFLDDASALGRSWDVDSVRLIADYHVELSKLQEVASRGVLPTENSRVKDPPSLDPVEVKCANVAADATSASSVSPEKPKSHSPKQPRERRSERKKMTSRFADRRKARQA